MATSVVMNRAGLSRLRVLAEHEFHEVCEEIATEMRRLAPVDTGQLRENISVEPTGPGDVTIWSRRPAGPMGVPVFVEFGTRPHVITPDTQEALSWPGANHPVKKVDHPGTAAQPYMRPALYRRRRGSV